MILKTILAVVSQVSRPQVEESGRQVYLMQRKSTRVGRGLGKTTGWTHRMSLDKRGVQMINGIDYEKVDDQGLHVTLRVCHSYLKWIR